MCHIVAHQPVRGKLGDQEVANMIRASAQPAIDTFKTISDNFKKVRAQFDGDLASIGMQVSEKMIKGNGVWLESTKHDQIWPNMTRVVQARNWNFERG